MFVAPRSEKLRRGSEGAELNLTLLFTLPLHSRSRVSCAHSDLLVAGWRREPVALIRRALRLQDESFRLSHRA
jgi:hypothetical protein